MIKKELSTSITAVGVYALLSILPSASGIILLPVYLKHLDPSAYGALAILGIFSGFYALVANLQINVAAGVNYFDYQDNPTRLKKYISSIFSSSVLLSTISYFLFISVGNFFFEIVIKSDELQFFPFGLIVLSSSFMSQIPIVYFVFLKNEYKLKDLFLYTFTTVILNIGFQYYFIVIQLMGLMGSVLGSLIAKSIVTVVFIAVERRLFDFRPNSTMIRDSLKFSLPYIPIILMNWLLTVSDRFFLEQLMDLSAVGRYALLINILLLANTGFTAVWNGFTPKLLRYFKRPDTANTSLIQKIVQWHFKIGLLVLSGTILLGSNIGLFTNNLRYISIAPLFSLGALAMLPRLMKSIPNLQLMHLKQSKIISWCSFISFVTLLLSFYTLIPAFELTGAVLALGISNVTAFSLIYLISKKRFNVPFVLGKNKWTILIAFLLVLIVYLFCENFEYSIQLYGLIQFLTVLTYLVVVSLADIKMFVTKIILQ